MSNNISTELIYGISYIKNKDLFDTYKLFDLLLYGFSDITDWDKALVMSTIQEITPKGKSMTEMADLTEFHNSLYNIAYHMDKEFNGDGYETVEMINEFIQEDSIISFDENWHWAKLLIVIDKNFNTHDIFMGINYKDMLIAKNKDLETEGVLNSMFLDIHETLNGILRDKVTWEKIKEVSKLHTVSIENDENGFLLDYRHEVIDI